MEGNQDSFEITQSEIQSKISLLDFWEELNFYENLNFSKKTQSFSIFRKIKKGDKRPCLIDDFYKKMMLLYIYSYFQKKKEANKEELQKIKNDIAECYYHIVISKNYLKFKSINKKKKTYKNKK